MVNELIMAASKLLLQAANSTNCEKFQDQLVGFYMGRTSFLQQGRNIFDLAA